MPIGSIITQPATNSINAAYRPVVLRVSATKTDGTPIPPVVYCDIYFAGIYYKTISKTQYTSHEGANTQWQFDIQDALQEYLQKYIEDNGEQAVVEVTESITEVFCRFRSSGIDTDGFLQQEGTAPIQGTDDEDPVAGTGTQSNTFYGINATLQHEDNQDLADHLDAYKNRTWAANTYPLTHRPDRYKLCAADSDMFPIVSDKPPLRLVLHYQDSNGNWTDTDSDLACTEAAPVESVEIPNATTGVAYNYELNFTGTAPFSITDIVKPSWMTITLSGSTVTFSGTPDDADIDTDVPVSFNLNNCIESAYAFNQVIDVNCVGGSYVGDPDIPDAIEDVAYSYELEIAGTAPFSLSSVVKPAWMTISLVGKTITFSGTPTSTATDEEVSFSIDNCGDSLLFDQTIDTVVCTAILITNNQLPDAVVGEAYNELVAFDAGTLPVIINIGSTKPSWMTVAVEGSGLRFTGTPTVGDIDTNVPISIVLTNCGGEDTYIDTIDVAGAAHKIAGNYTGAQNAIFDVCTVQVLIARSAQATDDATAANERVEVEYQVDADNGCTITDTVIFEVADSIKYEDVDVLCGGSYACTSAIVTILTVTVIP